nr:hypothetical protein [Thermoproteota archaeon]
MNHNITLAIVAIVAATALTAIPIAVPQQALAGGHHYKHNNNHNSKSIKVDQQIGQANFCNGTSSTPDMTARTGLSAVEPPSSSTTCANIGDN